MNSSPLEELRGSASGAKLYTLGLNAAQVRQDAHSRPTLLGGSYDKRIKENGHPVTHNCGAVCLRGNCILFGLKPGAGATEHPTSAKKCFRHRCGGRLQPCLRQRREPERKRVGYISRRHHCRPGNDLSWWHTEKRRPNKPPDGPRSDWKVAIASGIRGQYGSVQRRRFPHSLRHHALYVSGLLVIAGE